MAWHAKEVVRSAFEPIDPQLALEFVGRLGRDLQDDSCPPEVRQLGRTIVRWRTQIPAWHQAQVSNGPTEAVNNLIKRVKRVAFGSAASPTTASEPCSTPGDPTGTYSRPSHPAGVECPRVEPRVGSGGRGELYVEPLLDGASIADVGDTLDGDLVRRCARRGVPVAADR
jgi:hypothetical protein